MDFGGLPGFFNSKLNFNKMESWEQMLKKKFEENREDFSKMVTTLSAKELSRKFDDGYGGTEGSAFTAWGERYVYFPVCYDGAEWVGSAPRNPCDEETEHQGGG